MFNHILLASHGTEGAQAAEYVAISNCVSGGKLSHLLVVPELWQGMTGDDWLTNGHTRDDFCRYLETELGKEIDEHCERIRRTANLHQLNYTNKIILGEPDKVLVQYSTTQAFDSIIIGSPRPKGVAGLRSRLLTENMMRSLKIPLIIAPYPL